MAKLVFGLNQSLDGYVDHQEFAPGPSLFRHFTEQVRDLAGSVYGRRMYEVMRYWDEDRPESDAEERDFAAAWRSQPKWVVSRTLKSVGPNATLVADDHGRGRSPMNPIRRLANLYGSITYAIGPERWIPRLTQRVLCSVRTKEKKIALTFDDGPNPEYTPLLLTRLAEYRVSATFFPIGRNLKRHPEIGRRIVQEGHEVGNHTYNHRILPFLSNAGIINELASTQQLIADLLNVQPVFFRPPNGLFTARVLDTVEQLGYRAVVGDVFPVDVA